MLQYLHAYGMLSRKELAEKLEVNPRNIYEYKKDLIMLGYDIESTPGRGGGYKLNDKYIMKLPTLKRKEQVGLRTLVNHLNKFDAAIGDEDSLPALEKVCNSYENKYIEFDEYIITSKSCHQLDIQELYTNLRFAIAETIEVNIYYDSYNGLSEKLLRPYAVVNSNSIWYLIAFDVQVEKFKTFRLSRIKEINLSRNCFYKDPNFKIQTYIDDLGLKIGKSYRIKLRVEGKAMKSIVENPLGSDVYIENFNDYIIYESNVRGEYVIDEFILKMGSNCEVLEPGDLRRRIIKVVSRMFNNYDM